MNARTEWRGAELVLVLEEVEDELRDGVLALRFEHDDARFVRRFRADAPYAEDVAERFPACAHAMVRQAASLERAPWEEGLDELVRRTPEADWWLAGSAALAARGLAVTPRDLDVIASPAGAAELAARLADALVEPLVPAGALGELWCRAFLGVRVEILGGPSAASDDPEPSDFGPAAAAGLETVAWRGHELRVPPLELQLRVSERRGLHERGRLIREALA